MLGLPLGVAGQVRYRVTLRGVVGVGLMWCTYAAPVRLQQVADVIWFFLVPALLVLFVAVSRLGVAKKLSTDDNNPRKE